LLSKLLKPRFPSSAVGIEKGAASIVQLDRSRGGFVVKRASSVNLPRDLILPAFDESNIADPSELVAALTDLMTSAGLLRQRKWSVALPEASSKAAILTLEGAAGSRSEVEEVLEWKIERALGAPINELRIAREPLPPNEQKQARYLVTGVRLDVLAEYESVFAALGWQTGLILPRHAGEEQWLRNGQHGDALLLTTHNDGFTAVLMRRNQPVTLRSVVCDEDECDDELHRFLLFYRDRAGSPAGEEGPSVDRLLVLGRLLDKQHVVDVMRDTLGVNLRPLDAGDVGLTIPASDIPFDVIAAPAGLARLAW
jgi:hypothetical protein